MDLRNLSSTPSQLDIHRRPSLSSLSSTSGYASSSFGVNPGQAGNANANNSSNTTSTVTGGASSNTHGTAASTGNPNQGPKLNGINPSTVSNAWFSGSNPVNDVTPWVEQQKQQQSKVGSLDLSSKDKEKKKDGAKSSETPVTAAAVVAAAAGVASSPGPNGSKTPQTGPASPAGPHGPRANRARKINDSSDDADDNDDDYIDDDELIPTAIVIKNIPFAIKKEQLLDVMTKLSLPLPYAFNYHFDNGVFRGLAFANFTSTDETSLVVDLLNGREIGGRKLRVEYKKMLPAQERERIEREKREKRGQLEEQHRSTSNASLASLMSGTSTTAATKNLSVNGINQQLPQERMFLNFPSSSNFNLPAILPTDVNFNDLEALELFSQLIAFKDDNLQKTMELAYPPNLSLPQRKLLSSLCGYLNLLELYDNGLIIIRRKPGQFFQALNPINSPTNPAQSGGATASNINLNLNGLGVPMGNLGGINGAPPLGGFNGMNGGDQTPHSSNSMMNLNQLNGGMNQINNPLHTSTHPELLRSHSQSALPLPRLRQQNSTPVQQYPYPNGTGTGTGSNGGHSHSNSSHLPYQHSGPNSKGSLYQGIQPFGFMPQNQAPLMPNQLNGPSSAAAILRTGSSSRPYGDLRSTPPLTNSFTSTESPTPGQMYDGNTTTGATGATGTNGTGASTGTSANSTPTTSNVIPVSTNGSISEGTGSNPTIAEANNDGSQPSTPLQTTDINSRFAPFGQHSQLTGSLTSLPTSARHSEDYSGNELTGKFNNFNINYDGNATTGIWGPK